ncbi:hypothetical protein FRIGORI9N_20003 [Frigoribacterium sp. 9N]|nr:hypothetical protein FRIGORI9N_20003 [Frigoribacterium sp. 9N]
MRRAGGRGDGAADGRRVPRDDRRRADRGRRDRDARRALTRASSGRGPAPPAPRTPFTKMNPDFSWFVFVNGVRRVVGRRGAGRREARRGHHGQGAVRRHV